MRTTPRKRHRRGVLLLLILGMLAMFGLIAITFVLLAGHHQRGAEVAKRIDEYPVRPETMLNEALGQALRGSENAASPLRIHGLLEDMYGTGWTATRIGSDDPAIAAIQPIAGGRLVELLLGTYRVPSGSPAGIWNPLPTPHDYIGRVITFTSGLAEGRSTRIVGAHRVGTDASGLPVVRVQILARDWPPIYGSDGQPGRAGVDDDGSGTVDDVTETGWPESDDYIHRSVAVPTGYCYLDRVVINGPDFAGTGIGYNPGANNLSVSYTSTNFGDWPYALLPNPAFPPNTNYSGTNEDYDAVDYQNMLLALVRSEATLGNGEPRVVIPSLHRAALVSYWFQTMATSSALSSLSQTEARQVILWPYGADGIRQTADEGSAPWSSVSIDVRDEIAALKRKIIFRPLREDNPNFSGSNPIGFPPDWDGLFFDNPTSPDGVCDYAWDVDNDGDGLPDGIWVDLGFPARSAPDGRLYKPLFSFLCVDLDGRLNVNAHGSLAQAATAYYGSIASPDRAGVPALRPSFATGATSAALPRGQGYGPADINLGPLFGDGNLPASPQLLTACQQLLSRRYETVLADGTTEQVPGARGDDPLSQNLAFQYWNECWREGTQFLGLPPAWNYDFWKYYYDAANYVPCGYGSAFDMLGNGAIGLDLRGAPLYPQMCDPTDHVDDPYEVNLLQGGGDRPYTLADLERVLRRFDHDGARLPQRLAPFLSNPLHNAETTTELTTESFNVPTNGGMVALRNWVQIYWASLSADQRTAIRQGVSDSLGRLGPNKPDLDVEDLLIVRLAVGLAPADIPDVIPALLPRLLPAEIHMNLRMDLNRPFGNGLDDNANGVVDEPAFVVRSNASPPNEFAVGNPGELALPNPKVYEKVPQVDASGGDVLDALMHHSKGVDVTGDGVVDGVDRALARQEYARQLYVLVLLLIDHQVADPTNPQPAELSRAKFAAQWAVNVVDFRDRDSIMTPFEYDVSPFSDEDGDNDTWDVDGVIDTDPGVAGSDDDETGHPWRRLVWGCERPELLITETLAFHDRATEDMNLGTLPDGSDDDYHYNPDDPGNADDDFDQKKRPRGSLFVELYNPWTFQDPPTAELHHTTQGGVDLTKMVPGSRSPVWRLAIFDDPNKDLEPDDTLQVPERSVYFVDASAPLDIPPGQDGLQHYPSNPPTTSLLPGRYALIGPGDNDQPAAPTTTYLGLKNGTNLPDGTTRRIVLPGGSVSAVDMFINRSTTQGDLEALRSASRIYPPLGIAVDKANVQSGFQAATDNLRLSVSEPQGGYPTQDLAGNVFDTTNQVYVQPFEEPLDSQHNAALWPTLVQNGTFIGFRVIHLQRLANPMLPWDQHRNPYITVDAMLVDLTAFNGTPETPGHEGDDPTVGGAAPDIDESANMFCTRERGENGDRDGQGNDNDNVAADLWRQGPLVDRDGSVIPPLYRNDNVGTVANHAFNNGLEHTLGYLNWDLNGATLPRNAPPFHIGDPANTPFPWLAWYNRPFISPMEILQVPGLTPGRLLRHPLDVGDVNFYPYGRTFSVIAPAVVPNPAPHVNAADNFWHLPNFFLAQTSGAVPHSLYPLLDLVDVPSPFVGAQMQGNPSVFGAVGGSFGPPFDNFSLYREPGLVNINTVFSPNVWKGVVNYLASTGAMDTSSGAVPWQWNDLLASRRGSALGGMYAIDSNYPSRFANPFRSAGSALLVPPLQSVTSPFGLGPPPQGGPPPFQRPVDATLLRVSPGGSNTPLFEYASTANITDTDRNPYFRYQMLQKLSNLVTTRSNVYAIWITVGFFEVEPWPPRGYEANYAGAPVNPHPDGFSLGQELGMDTGEVRRHRAFYIIDRSIPVGFIRGRDLNAEKAIRLKRFIE